jgi:hypothetical protein
LHIIKILRKPEVKVSNFLLYNLYKVYLLTLILENDIVPQKNDFFNLQTQKQPRNYTITNINHKDIINNKILSFIIDNNLSFNILNSESFQDLIRFFKP